jgi:hypothetical protein
MDSNASTSFVVNFTQQGWEQHRIARGGIYAEASTFPDGRIERGKRYNTSELNGSVYFIAARNERQIQFNKTFKVVNMTTWQGEPINGTNVQNPTVSTRGPENFSNWTDDWQEEWDRQQEVDKNISKNYSVTILPGLGSLGLDSIGSGWLGATTFGIGNVWIILGSLLLSVFLVAYLVNLLTPN